ncbi:MAG: hypothetical protein WKF40_02925 [Thermoleophilaceae bacterium]
MAWLLCDDARWITAQVLNLEGGLAVEAVVKKPVMVLLAGIGACEARGDRRRFRPGGRAGGQRGPPVATVSEEMVSLARERAPGAEVVVGRAEQLPFADADFWAHRYNVRGVRLCVLANVELVRMSPGAAMSGPVAGG